MGAVPALDRLLATQALWHAGRVARACTEGQSTGHAGLDALLPQHGWPRRALTELLLPADGIGELSLLLPTLARCTQAGAPVALVAPPYVPYAPAWQTAGVDLAHLQVIDAAPRDALWAFEQCLRSGACAAVLGWPAQADARALRRLQVAADSGQSLGFALRDRRHGANPSPAALRLEAVCDAHGTTAWHVRKCRGGPPPARVFAVRSAHGAGLAASRAADAASIARQAALDAAGVVSIARLPGLASIANAHPQASRQADGSVPKTLRDRDHGRIRAHAPQLGGAAMAADASPESPRIESIRAQARSHSADTDFLGADLSANVLVESRNTGSIARTRALAAGAIFPAGLLAAADPQRNARPGATRD